MLRPFVVNIETEIVVMAESEKDAEKWTRRNWDRFVYDDLNSDSCDIYARKMTHYPGNWDKDCLPYGTTDDIKLGEILANDPDYQNALKKLQAVAGKHIE